MRSQSKNIKDCFYKKGSFFSISRLTYAQIISVTFELTIGRNIGKDPKSVEASNSSYKRVANALAISVFSTTVRIYFVQYELVSVIDIAIAFDPFLTTNSAGPTSFSPDFQLYVYPSLVQG